MKILVTGCSGSVGNMVCKTLKKKKKHTVHGLDIDDSEIPMIDHFYHTDLNRPLDISESYDCIIHLAAETNIEKSEDRPIQTYITNVNGTMNLVNRVSTKSFIMVSTEKANECSDVYHRSKRVAEDVAMEYYQLHKMAPIMITRTVENNDKEAYNRVMECFRTFEEMML